MAFSRAIALLGLLALTGCEPTLTPAPAPASPSAAPTQASLTIAALSYRSKFIVGKERIQAYVTLGEAGSGTLVAYGLASRFGEQRFEFKPHLPVVPGGRLTLELGPVPKVAQAGPLEVALWLEDSEGRVSNRLSEQVTIQ